MQAKIRRNVEEEANGDAESEDSSGSEADDDWSEEILFESPLDSLDVYNEFSQVLQRNSYTLSHFI